jgi:hypothetical protein
MIKRKNRGLDFFVFIHGIKRLEKSLLFYALIENIQLNINFSLTVVFFKIVKARKPMSFLYLKVKLFKTSSSYRKINEII